MNQRKLATATIFLKVLYCAAAAVLLCSCWAVGWSSYTKHHAAGSMAGLTSHPDTFAALKKRDFADARRILEPKLRTHPNDPEINYTLGCVDLMQSEEVSNRERKRALQIQGWRRVESASGEFYHADMLLAHAYLVGRWGKKRNQELYAKHMKLESDGFKSQGGKTNEARLLKRTWLVLSP